MKARKKPVVIEAERYDGTPESAYKVMAMGGSRGINNSPEGLYITTLEGVMRADKGDWIIKGVNGEMYPCKPDIFLKTYDVLEEAKQDDK